MVLAERQFWPTGPDMPQLGVDDTTADVWQQKLPPGSAFIGSIGGMGSGPQSLTAQPPLPQPENWDMWKLPSACGGDGKPVEAPPAPALGGLPCAGSAGEGTAAVAPPVETHLYASTWASYSLPSEGSVPAPQPAPAPCVLPAPEAPVVGAAAYVWSLPSEVSKAETLRPTEGSVRRFLDARVGRMCVPLVAHLGPLSTAESSDDVEAAKRRYAQSLVLRGHGMDQVESVVRNHLDHIQESMQSAIEQRYSKKECPTRGRQLVELVVLDGCFVIELFLQHWTRRNKGATAPATANQEPSETAKWEPHALRFDLIVVQNQIPFFVLDELFNMIDIPEIIIDKGPQRRAFLRKIAVDYLVGGVTGEVLLGYDGPVHHLLHLLYLHLSNDPQPPSPPPPSQQRPWSRAVCNCVSEKFQLVKENLRGVRKKMRLCTSPGTPVSWQVWKTVPPARELVRVGVRLRRKDTQRVADVTFRDGTIEIPPFHWRDFDFRLLTNLVALELAAWWPPEKALFCSYAKFMAELVATKEDVALLCKEGIILCNDDEIASNLVTLLRTLADLNHGSGYQCQYAELVGKIIKYYERLINVGFCGCFAS